MLFNFTKMHGLGNDMILIDDREEKIRNINEFARRILHRNTGVGADNLLIVRKPSLPGADVRMLILNNDGSEAEMCGNGIRCFVKFIIEKGIVPAPDVSVETLSGIKKLMRNFRTAQLFASASTWVNRSWIVRTFPFRQRVISFKKAFTPTGGVL